MNDRTNNANVVPLFRGGPPRGPTISQHRPSPFDELTAAMVMAKHARGELDPALLAALLAGCGISAEAPQ
jgi:hypothetical protein